MLYLADIWLRRIHYSPRRLCRLFVLVCMNSVYKKVCKQVRVFCKQLSHSQTSDSKSWIMTRPRTFLQVIRSLSYQLSCNKKRNLQPTLFKNNRWCRTHSNLAKTYQIWVKRIMSRLHGKWKCAKHIRSKAFLRLGSTWLNTNLILSRLARSSKSSKCTMRARSRTPKWRS